jgi:hypothetical protein
MNCTAKRDAEHITGGGDTRKCEVNAQGVCLLEWTVMRRVLILGLALTVFSSGLVPLSACALRTSKLAECATPKTQSRCDQMNMDESGAPVVTASDTSCCSISDAPVPQSQNKASGFSLAAPILFFDATADIPRTQGLLPARIVQDLSPRPLQSLLCTFLI